MFIFSNELERLTEDQLIQGILKNKPGAAGVLYDRYAPVLLGLCMRYCGNREDAEDVMHDGLIQILRHLHSFKARHHGAFEGWMKRIMINTSLNFLRIKKSRDFIRQDEIHLSNQPDAHDDTTALPGIDLSREELLSMIASLPEGYRAVFNMYVFDDYSHKEIAEILGCSENTSKSQLSKARALLRKKIEEVVHVKYAEQ